MCPPHVSLLLNIDLLGQASVELEYGAFQSDDSLLAASQAPLQVVDLGFVLRPLLIHLGDVLLIPPCHLVFKRLYILLECTNLMKQAVLVLLLHAGVFLELLSDLCDLSVEVITGSLTISQMLLILCYISLQVIENLQLLIQCNQGVELVLQLYLLFLER